MYLPDGQAEAPDEDAFASASLELDPRAGVPDGAIPCRKVGPPDGWRRAGRRFVRGPLALDWIGAALGAGHAKALPMLLALRFRVDASGDAWVKPPSSVLAGWGFSADDRSRAIAALERAGLIEVRRRRGRPPLVRLAPATGSADG